jgi:hypothetical protein
MSISGYEPGAIRAKLDALKKQGKDRRDAAIAKLDDAGKKHEAVSKRSSALQGRSRRKRMQRLLSSRVHQWGASVTADLAMHIVACVFGGLLGWYAPQLWDIK